MNIITSTIIVLIISLITIGIHYFTKQAPIFAIVDNSEVRIKKRRNLKYKITFNTLPSTTSLVVPSSGVQPIEFISITSDPKDERPPIPSDRLTGINGINKMFIYNCNSADVLSIRAFNLSVSNATSPDPNAKIPPIKAYISTTDMSSKELYDGVKPINMNPGYQISIDSNEGITLNKVVLICDNIMPVSMYVYFIDSSGMYKGIRFDGIKNDIFVIDLYKS